MLALAAAVVLSQTIYTWVDGKGVTHYTDGATGIPEDAEKTEGAPISVVKHVPLPPKKPEPVVVAPKAAVVPVSPEPQPEVVVASEPVDLPMYWAPTYWAPLPRQPRAERCAPLVPAEPAAAAPAPAVAPPKPKPAPTRSAGRF